MVRLKKMFCDGFIFYSFQRIKDFIQLTLQLCESEDRGHLLEVIETAQIVQLTIVKKTALIL